MVAQVLGTHETSAESAPTTHPPASLVCVLLSRCTALFCLYAVRNDTVIVVVLLLLILLFYGDDNRSNDTYFVPINSCFSYCT